MLLYPVISLSAVTSCRVMTPYNRRETLPGIAVANEIEGITALCRNVPHGVLQSVNMDTHHALTAIPGLDNFMIDPFPPCRVRAYQNNRAGSSIHLVTNPSLYGFVPTPLHRFPVIVCRRAVPFYRSNVSYLPGAPIVGLVMKAVEDSTFHLMHPWLQGLRKARASEPEEHRKTCIRTKTMQRSKRSRLWLHTSDNLTQRA